jgi:hypothetical protein
MSEIMNQEPIYIPYKKALTLSTENIFKPSFNVSKIFENNCKWFELTGLFDFRCKSEGAN